MIIDAVSHDYPGPLPPNTWLSDETIRVRDDWHPSTLVLRIQRLTGRRRVIQCLRLWSHGNSGWVAIGTGLDAANASSLAPLADLFVADGAIEMHACGVASAIDICRPGGGPECHVRKGRAGNGVGFVLLQAVANATGVTVEAPVHSQHTLNNFVGMGSFQGATMTAAPTSA
jgi:hypothetical protein